MGLFFLNSYKFEQSFAHLLSITCQLLHGCSQLPLFGYILPTFACMKPLLIKYLAFALVALVALSSCEQKKPLFVSKSWKFKMGDNLAWASPNLDDSQWSTQVIDSIGVFWLRTRITLPTTPNPHRPLGLWVVALASSEAYWDGVHIGNNGKVGTNRAQEVAGLQMHAFAIPSKLAQAGTHQVALRMSNFRLHPKEIRFYIVSVADYWRLGRASLIVTALIHIYAGLFVVIALYFGFMFFINKRQLAHLLFACLCLTFFGLLLTEYIKFYITYYYHWHFPRLYIILGLNMLAGILMPLFFNYQFGYRFNKFILITFPPVAWLFTYVPSYDFSSALIMLHGMSMSLYIVIKATYEKKKGSKWSIIGLLPMLFFIFWFDIALFVAFGNLVLCVLVSLTMQMREQRHQHEASLLRSSWLEIELLKKNIQPHFLMNSLTSAIDWIEENPTEGIKLLNALVKEFDILLDISDKQMIPLAQEIALCSSHLEIMSFRKEIAYQLETSGINPDTLIPPALLHTAIENGISHNDLDQPSILFKIDCVHTNQKVQYHIFNEADVSQATDNYHEGTGFKYMKARLEESYPNQWQLEARPVAGGWQTTITIHS